MTISINLTLTDALFLTPAEPRLTGWEVTPRFARQGPKGSGNT